MSLQKRSSQSTDNTKHKEYEHCVSKFSVILFLIILSCMPIFVKANPILYETTAKLTVTPSPSVPGQQVHLTATIDTIGNLAASSNVTFKDGATELGLAKLEALGISLAMLAAGERHSCALSTSGRVWCWGSSSNGQLGNGTTTSFNPIPIVVPNLQNVKALVAGKFHTCALTLEQVVLCWGLNSSGQLGDGSFEPSLTPISVSGLTGATALVAGENHTCALTVGGRAFCWGSGSLGQLGYGGTGPRNTPIAVSNLTGATALAAGGYHTCALTVGGVAYCWGWNYYGQLGDGSTLSKLTPVAVSNLPTTTALAVGGSHTCALAINGDVSCWGWNGLGQLGDGSTTDKTTPVSASGLSGATVLSANLHRTCALTSNSELLCWGHGGGGVGSNRPNLVSDVVGAHNLAVGASHSCALMSGGAVSCWGTNIYGQLGRSELGDGVPSLIPNFTLLNRSVATLTTASFAGLGTRLLSATLVETNTHQGVVATINHAIKDATRTSVVSSHNPSVFAASVTFSATVTATNGTPAGTVTFFRGFTVLNTAPLTNGVATLRVSDLPVGITTVTAHYNGSDDYLSSTSAAISQTVTRAAQTISFIQPAPQSFATGKIIPLHVSASSGLPVTRTSESTDVCVTLGTSVRLMGVGTCTIRTTQVGNANFLAAPAITRTFTVTAALRPELSALGASARLHEQGFPSLAPFGAGAVMAYASQSTATGPFGILRQNLSVTGAASGSPVIVAAPAVGVGEPDVAALMSGHVIVWHAHDGFGNGIFAQRFTRAGKKTGPVFRVNATIAGSQSRPRVTALPGGGFAVVWQTMVSATDDDVWMRVFNASGSALTSDTRVNTMTARKQNNPDIAAVPTGTIAVTWTSETAVGRFSVHHRLFRANGQPVSAQTTTAPLNQQLNPMPVIAARTGLGAASGFAVAFTRSEIASIATPADVVVKFVSLGGAASTRTLRVNTVTGGHQASPAIAALKAGGFVVAFTTPDGSSTGIGMRMFSPLGAALGSEERANMVRDGAQFAPTLSPLGSTGATRGATFLNAWTTRSAASATGSDIMARLFQGP